MLFGFEKGIIVLLSPYFDPQLTEDGDGSLSICPRLAELQSGAPQSTSSSAEHEMAPSSPLSSLVPSQSQKKPTSSSPDPKLLHYRPAKPLPFELAHHVLIYFEELLHMQAFNLLTSLLSSGASSFNQTSPATAGIDVSCARSSQTAALSR